MATNGDKRKMSKFVTALKTLPKEKQARINRLIFNPKVLKETCSTHHRKGDKKGPQSKFYTCPQCGFEDKSLAVWRKAQSSEEKWAEFYNLWYKKKKLEKHFKALKETQAERPLTKEELYAKLEGLKSFSRISQMHLSSVSSPEKSVLRQSTPEKPDQLDVFGERGRTNYLSTVPEASDESVNVGTMDSNVFRSSEEFSHQTLPCPEVSGSEQDDLDQGLIHADSEDEAEEADETAEIRDEGTENLGQGLLTIAQNYDDDQNEEANDEESEDEILRREAQLEQEMDGDTLDFNQTLKERRRATVFQNPTVSLDESSEVQAPEGLGLEEPSENPETTGPELETTQEVQDEERNDTENETPETDHQVIPGPSGTPAIQVCQLSDNAK